MFQGQVQIRNRLSFNALGGIYNQQSPLAGCNGSGHLVRKIHVARGIDQIKYIVLIIKTIIHLNRMALDGDAPFPLQIHIVQGLRLQVPVSHSSCNLQESIRQGAFAVINVGDDAEIPDLFHGYAKVSPSCPGFGPLKSD